MNYLMYYPSPKFLTGLTDEEKVALEGQRLTFLRSFKY